MPVLLKGASEPLVLTVIHNAVVPFFQQGSILSALPIFHWSFASSSSFLVFIHFGRPLSLLAAQLIPVRPNFFQHALSVCVYALVKAECARGCWVRRSGKICKRHHCRYIFEKTALQRLVFKCGGPSSASSARRQSHLIQPRFAVGNASPDNSCGFTQLPSIRTFAGCVAAMKRKICLRLNDAIWLSPFPCNHLLLRLAPFQLPWFAPESFKTLARPPS